VGSQARIWAVMAAPLLMIAIAVVGALLIDAAGPLSKGLDLSGIKIERAVLLSETTRLPALIGDPLHLRDALSATSGNAPEHERIRDDFKVDLIVIGRMGRLAEINGRFLRQGDVIDGVQIRTIEKDRVLIVGREAFWSYIEKR